MIYSWLAWAAAVVGVYWGFEPWLNPVVLKVLMGALWIGGLIVYIGGSEVGADEL